MQMPDGLSTWTVDEAAECLDVSRELSGKLWGFLDESDNPTPLGGDGSDGTVETPDGRLDPSNGDKLPHWWQYLTTDEQAEIAAAFKKALGDDDE